MELGAFSVSLSVQDLDASRTFYEQLGFEVIGGEAAQNWLILRNREHVIGLFQGMFDKNILTFSPGWNQRAEELDQFLDIRQIQQKLKEQGIPLLQEADTSATGPASIILQDPDGNQILIDQHRDKAQ